MVFGGLREAEVSCPRFHVFDTVDCGGWLPRYSYSSQYIRTYCKYCTLYTVLRNRWFRQTVLGYTSTVCRNQRLHILILFHNLNLRVNVTSNVHMEIQIQMSLARSRFPCPRVFPA